jgi:hypothetical protein
MVLLTTFVITVLLGDLVAIAICAVIEQFSKNISLLAFLAMFWGLIPLAWRFAVRATEPEGLIMRRLGR